MTARSLKVVTPSLPLSALVARVSDPKQAKEGYSLDAQVPMLKQIAEREGFRTDPRYILFDDGYQGDDWNRPAINKAVELAAAGTVKAVTFLNTDRFARDVVGGRAMVAKILATGATVIFGDLGRFRDDANFMLMLNLKLSLAEYEKAMIRMRSGWGTAQKLKDQEVIVAVPSYGYEKFEDSLRILEGEAEIVRLIYQWYDEGMSVRAILRRLKADKVPPPGATRKHTKFKGNWNSATVNRILKDRTYIGEWHYGKTKCVKPKTRRSTKPQHKVKSSQVQTPPSEWKKVPVDPIIDKPLFERVQMKRASNKHVLGGRPSDKYPLKGLLFCAVCKRPYVGNSTKGVRYCCSNRCRDTGKVLCPALSVRADLIEPVIYGAVEELLTQREILEAAVQKLRKGSPSREKRDSLFARSEELRRLEFKARRDKIHAPDDATEKFYAQEIKELMAQREEVQRQIQAIMPAIASIDADQIVAAAKKGFATKDAAKRREILRHFVKRAEYDYRDHSVSIQVAIPIQSKYCLDQQADRDSILLIPIKRRVA